MFSSRVWEINSMQDIFDESVQEKRQKRTFKHRPDYLKDYTDENFVQRFRLSKESCQFLLGKIRAIIQPNTKNKNALSANTKLLLTLRFYACGSFLITVGDFCGVSVSAASRVVKEVSIAIASLSKEFIKFPEEIQNTVADFYLIAKFPRVIGTIDCTHVRIQPPGGDNAEIYRNRKGFFSLNVQAVCDANLLFEDLVARWPGSSHDSNIFRHSRLNFRMESGEFENLFLLGDSGYQVSEYMMTPLLNPFSKAEKLYNESQIRTRNCIERCFGVWKRRFPVLALGIRLAVNTTMGVIAACAVLHNIAILSKDPLPKEDINLPPDDWEEMRTDVLTTTKNARTRSILIENYFLFGRL